MLEIWIGLIFTAIVAIAVLYIISIWVYKRAPANMGFIRTGWRGTKVCLGRGAIVLPVFHEISWISLESIKLLISRTRDQAVLTSDNIRVDVVTELYTHVGRTEDDLLTASRSLGEKTFDTEKVRNLLEAKVVSAIRSYAATKTLKELHQNRDAFAQQIKDNVFNSFRANGLELEEATIVSLEQTGKEFFRTDNVFDAEGLKVITEITSEARKKVHDTEKRTAVAIRQKDLDTELEMLEIERKEAVAKATQDKEISNEQARQLGEKQIYMLDRRKDVEQKELSNEVELEQIRTDREVSITQEAKKRETVEIQRDLALEQERRDKEIALIDKAREEELAEVKRRLALEMAEEHRQAELAAAERERRKAEINRETEVANSEEAARDIRHAAAEEAAISIRRRALETKLAMLEIDKNEAFAAVRHDREVSDEKATVLSEQQKLILERRLEVQNEEIRNELELERSRIGRDAEVALKMRDREAAEIQRQLARQQEERDSRIALIAKDEQVRQAEIKRELTVELEERDSEIALIAKEQEREVVDINRFRVREHEERDREIAFARKTKELEEVEIERLATSRDKVKAEHVVGSVGPISQAEQNQQVARINEEAEAEIARMHMVIQSEGRREAAERESDAILIRAKANSQAQTISAEGIEREAGARGRAEMAIEELRIENAQRMLEAEASGIEAKAGALNKYNEAATFLELAKLQIEAERDVHIDQAKAMGNALSQAQIRMYGGGDGTVDTIRSMFTTGFSLGEILEGVAQSLPDGLRERFAKNGVRGIWGRPYRSGEFKEMAERLNEMVHGAMANAKSRAIPFSEAVAVLEGEAGTDEGRKQALTLLKDANENGIFNDVSFDKVWALLQATAKAAD
jgi:uncharacterized membrane protein YqiK